ncbi:hypothetical protein PAMC26577_17615 [Caballeronia sordidicola]|uniref:Uncharacterized protein n=1 Tax=Caballeronia sordidicola TaxID=196367 RepID=A0A242MRU3_CABSO|nr:hypothetical protein PAMC26577_17615 [Caballeronia sordidicola]
MHSIVEKRSTVSVLPETTVRYAQICDINIPLMRTADQRVAANG